MQVSGGPCGSMHRGMGRIRSQRVAGAICTSVPMKEAYPHPPKFDWHDFCDMPSQIRGPFLTHNPCG
jgi:hypothetical protein